MLIKEDIMARPRKSRLVYSMPSCEGFVPVGYEPDGIVETVVMTIDEYETIRLIDLEKLNQEACAERMGISRPTVTNIYESARNKMADALINEKSTGWKTSRMAKVDLSIIRIAVYEIKFEDDIPFKVSVNEAVELAKKYGADESPAFVNGILAKFA